MTEGYSGSYAFNGTNLTLPPSEGEWEERNNYGVDGGGHLIYSPVRKFVLSWDLISTDDAKQIIDFYNTVSNTGTITACLPEWGNVGFVFRNYSGTTLEEPQVGKYFQGYIESVKMTVMNIRT